MVCAWRLHGEACEARLHVDHELGPLRVPQSDSLVRRLEENVEAETPEAQPFIVLDPSFKSEECVTCTFNPFRIAQR